MFKIKSCKNIKLKLKISNHKYNHFNLLIKVLNLFKRMTAAKKTQKFNFYNKA